MKFNIRQKVCMIVALLFLLTSTILFTIALIWISNDIYNHWLKSIVSDIRNWQKL